MTSRRTVPTYILALERRLIFQFVMEYIKLSPVQSPRLHMKEVFAEYCEWLKKQGCRPSQLTTDGFGRMFPKGFKRKHFVRNHQLAKGIEGVTWKQK